MKNKMDDLRNHLFEQLERLKDATDQDLQTEIDRSRAIVSTAGQLIDTAKVEVQYLHVTGQGEGSQFLRGRDPERPTLAAVDQRKIGGGS